ncbi:MAG: hypothetical protein Q9176_005607 [Flavoplaca citrina]
MKPVFKSPAGFTLNFPSTAHLSSLTRIMLNELKMELTHRGSYLLVKTTPLHEMFATFQDEEGNTHNVINCLQDGQQLFSEPYAIAQYIVLKEPLCKETGDGHPAVVILHLSDVTVLSQSDLMLPSVWQLTEVHSALQLKKLGNLHMKREAYYKAIECYNRGLNCTESTDLVEVLRLNRCQARVSIQSYETALDDAQFILANCSTGVRSPKYEKVLLLYTRALYELRRYEECIVKLAEFRELYPDNKLAIDDYRRCQQRLEEAATGQYDFARWTARVAQKVKKGEPPLIDAATYQGPITVRQSKYGCGLFTSHNVEAGDLLLCEKAFHCAIDIMQGSFIEDFTAIQHGQGDIGAFMKKPYGSTSSREPIHVRLKLGTLHKVYRNPGIYLPALTSLSPRSSQTAITPPSVLDSTLNNQIIEKNKFTTEAMGSLSALHDMFAGQESSQSPEYSPFKCSPITTCGMWFLACRANHSCLPNVCRAIIGDMLILRAATSIPANTEIFDGYVFASDQYPTRRADLKKTYGFTCECPYCRMDQVVSNKEHARRESLAQTLITLAIEPTAMSAKEIGSSLEQLAATYPSQQSCLGVPRLAMVMPLLSISQAAFTIGKNKRLKVAVIYFGLQLLRESGFQVNSQAGDGFDIENWGIMTQGAPETLWMMRETVGKKNPNWKGLDKALRKAYWICNGGKGGKGLGKGGAKRHRKILRDNIQGITKPAIRRLARRGGVKLIYEETRGVLKTFLESVIRDAVTYTEHAKRKTVTSLDVVYALKRQGRTLYGFGG